MIKVISGFLMCIVGLAWVVMFIILYQQYEWDDLGCFLGSLPGVVAFCAGTDKLWEAK